MAGKAIGRVEQARGATTVLEPGGGTQPLATGQPVHEGDRVATGGDGQVVLRFDDGAQFTIGPASTLVLDHLVYEPTSGSGSFLTSLVDGVLTFVTGKVASAGPDAMQVETPGGIVGIRGTEVGCSVAIAANASGDSATTCVLLADPNGHVGRMAFTNAGGSVVVQELYQSAQSASPAATPLLQQLAPADVRGLLGTTWQQAELEPDQRPGLPGHGSFTPYDGGHGFETGGLVPLQQLGPQLATDLAPPEPIEALQQLILVQHGTPPEPLPPPPPPPVEPPPPPQIVLTPSSADAAIGISSIGAPLPSAPPFPTLADGVPLDPSLIRGVAPADLTLDQAREVTVTLDPSSARFDSSVGVCEIAGDGSLVDARIIFAGTAGLTGEAAPITLPAMAAGTRLAFFLVSDGADLNPKSLLTGELKFLAAGSALDPSSPTAHLEDHAPPILVHVDPSGAVTPIQGDVFFTAGGDGQGHNLLNTGGFEQTVSGIDISGSALLIGFEDIARSTGKADDDLGDVTLRVQLDPIEQVAVFQPELGASARIDLAPGQTLGGAIIQLGAGAQPGDHLALAGLIDANHDGLLDGTGLKLVDDGSDGRIAVLGHGSAAAYEAVVEAVRLEGGGSGLEPGTRDLSLTLLDGQGQLGPSVEFSLRLEPTRLGGPGPDLLAGGNGPDALAGRGGDDQLFGNAGRDLLDGGSGRDQLFGGLGDDILVGGPGNDILTGGPGADRFDLAPGDRTDRITDFDATAGDRLHLGDILSQATPDTLKDFVRFQPGPAPGEIAVAVDRDGTASHYGFITTAILDHPKGIDIHTDPNPVVS